MGEHQPVAAARRVDLPGAAEGGEMVMPEQSPWNSLEVVTLIVDVLTPLALFVLGLWVQRLTHRLETTRWVHQKVIEKRIAVFEEVGPLANDLYCYFQWFGVWKELTPPEVIKIKRNMDRCMHVNKFLFSHRFTKAYDDFVSSCFETYYGFGTDARLRTSIVSEHGDRSRLPGKTWDPTWHEVFSPESEPANRKRVFNAYQALMSSFSDELGIVR